jgi:hypothetical protein
MGTIVCPTVINQKHSDALPKHYKGLLQSLRKPAHDVIVKEYKKSDEVNEEKWRSKA